ncbi:tdcG, partial [Symbiodinium pilosum]
AQKLDIATVVRTNEEARLSPGQVAEGLQELWAVMEQCIERGLDERKANEALPGPLQLRRRAPSLYQAALEEQRRRQVGGQSTCTSTSMAVMDELRWLNCYALAVMEENATMGRLVTAPTNGAAGVVPAVLAYYMRHLRPTQPEEERKDPATYLLTAATIGILAKERACISGAAGGCQAEVGTATAMAAAGLCALLGGRPDQVETAATVALEHSLGMTCDPVLGLVQAPCIERNSMGATKAVNAVALVLASAASPSPWLSLDGVLRVMKETGAAMDRRYRETALGGLAADYERSLGATPILQEKVKATMGFSRIQTGTRKQLRRQVTYEDLERDLITRRISSQSMSKC